MASSVINLNSFFQWQKILPILGVPLTSPTIPGRFTCPLCREPRLYIYEDTRDGGQWHHCRHCNSAGDMIALAAAVWKLDVPRTVRQAEQLGLHLQIPDRLDRDALVASYQKYILARRTRTREFWEVCRRYLPKTGHNEVLRMLDLMGVRRPLPANWVENSGRFIGACSRAHLEEAFPRDADSTAVRWIGPRRKGWNEMLVIPFFDLPHRICAFMLCANYLDVSKGDIRVWQPAMEYQLQRPGHESEEGGLAMLPAIFTSHSPRIGSQIFVMDDPIEALRLQLRHLDGTTVPLPLVGGLFGHAQFETRSVWKWLPVEKVVCWSEKPSRRLLITARKANSMVSMVSAPPVHSSQRTRRRESIEWLLQAARDSKPWADAARAEMVTQSTTALHELLLDLDFNGAELRKFITGSDEQLQARLQAATTQWQVTRQTRVGVSIIAEKESSWYVAGCISRDNRPLQLLCNAIIRVEQVITAGPGVSYLRGVVRFQGEEYQFTELAKTVERQPALWLKEFLLAQGAGVLRYMDDWGKRLLQVAYAFYEPEVVSGINKIGWDSKRLQFNFRSFAIQYDGNVNEEYACLLDNAALPGRYLRKPEPLYRKMLASLSEANDEVRLFWAVFACVVHNITSGAVHTSPCGIILDGAGAQGVGAAIASNLGCPEAFLPAHRAGFFANPEPAHLWPALILTPGQLNHHAVALWLQSAAARQSIMALPWAAARVLGIRNTWNIIRYPRQLGSMQLIAPTAAQVLPAYLQNLCSRKLYLALPHKSAVLNILEDVCSWFAESGGDASTAASAASLIEAVEGTPPWRHFLELMLRLRIEGKIDFARQGFETAPTKRGKPSILYLSDPSRLWIPQDAVCEQIQQLAAMPPDLLKITETLHASGALIGEEVLDGRLGWVVNEEWYTAHEKGLEKLL